MTEKPKPQAYYIDGKRLSKLKRAGLLRLCQSVHEDFLRQYNLAQEAINDFRIASDQRDMAVAQRDQAVAELDERVREGKEYLRLLREFIELTGKTETARVEMEVERDKYKRAANNNSLSLEACDTALSAANGTIAAIRRDATDLRHVMRIWRWVAVIASAGCGALGIAGLVWH